MGLENNMTDTPAPRQTTITLANSGDQASKILGFVPTL